MAKHKALPKRKAPKRKPREILLEKLDPYAEYGNDFPSHLAPMIWSEIGEDDRSPLWGLVEALHAIDQLGVTNPQPDKKPLIKLLKSTGTMWDKLLADLISRYDLTRPKRPGRPRQPIYRVSDEAHEGWQAHFEVQELLCRPDGKLSVDAAITQVAKKRGLPRQKVADAHQGRARAVRKKNQ
jgi:hypothetical protein